MFYSGDVLIITDQRNLETLKSREYKNAYFMTSEMKNTFYASANKIKIFEYERFLEYDACLFLDCDTLVLGDIDPIFEECESIGKVLVVEEESWYGFVQMHGPWYGGDLFTKEENAIIKEKKVNGINGGVFCLPANEKSKEIFRRIYSHLSEDFNEKKTNICLEQPYLNYHLYKNDYYSPMTDKIKTHHSDVSLAECDGKIIVHFFGGIGNYHVKHGKMMNTFEQLKNKTKK
jgi:lipopolysaccharide biosynthesis glycosyltransferase